jgi:MFS family permease
LKDKTHRFYYGWVIVAISFFTLFFSLGIRFSFGVFFIAILKEYGWSRGETAGAFSLAMVVHAIFAPVTGAIVDRFGPRKLFPIGSVFLIMGLMAASQITAIWHLYLFFGVAVAIGINTISYSPHMALIPRWFVRKRGLAAGLVLSGIGMGTLVIVPLVELIIDKMGWRSAFLILAGIILGIVLPMTALFQRRSPEEVGQYPDGIAPGSTRNLSTENEKENERMPTFNGPEQWTFKAALCTRAFWCMFSVVFCNGFLMNMLLVHQAIHTVDVGYSKMVAASMVGMVGLIGSIGGILCGHLSDRAGREISYTLGSAAAFVGVLLFMSIRDTTSLWMLYAFVILYGAGYGSMGPMTASTTGDLFPGNSVGRILAMQSVGFGMGGALGPYLGGYFYDQMGSYFIPFLLLLASIFWGVLGIWMAAPRHRSYGYPRDA